MDHLRSPPTLVRERSPRDEGSSRKPPVLHLSVHLHAVYRFAARFSPDDKFSRQRITIKKRFGLLPTQKPIEEL